VGLVNDSTIRVSRQGAVLHIELNRPEKRNAATVAMLQQLARAYGELDRDPELRVAVVSAIGDHFTGGLDLADVGAHLGAEGLHYVPEGGLDPWGVQSRPVSKPVVVAVNGTCFTLGIELILAADIAVAADDTSFAQLEVSRAILPFGGATLRFADRCGWGNAMRWMLTGERFDALEAHRIGLVQEVVSPGEHVSRALEIAQTIAAQAPLAVQATLANARLARSAGENTAAAALQPELMRLLGTQDAARGMQAFSTRSDATYEGN
jgi:enoyl-CoA hydratase/carnithine racemase